MTSSSVSSAPPVEHFVTVFNSKYLAFGLCLHRSLTERAGNFRLWIVCMDEKVEACLRELELPRVSLIPVGEVENQALLSVKPGRTPGEYCWTMTPFAPEFVMRRDPGAQRVTYLDADLYFFDDPAILLDEFGASGGHVLITEHAYAPAYENKAGDSGIYCVQFVTFRNTAEALEVMHWWQDRCIEWCFARKEDGKLGDQKYLDDWPVRFPGKVHVLRQKDRTLAPWNVAHYLDREGAKVPVLYHFHGFRIVSESKMRWYLGYHIGAGAQRYYRHYFAAMGEAMALMRNRWKLVPTIKNSNSFLEFLATVYYRLTGASRYASYSSGGE